MDTPAFADETERWVQVIRFAGIKPERRIALGRRASLPSTGVPRDRIPWRVTMARPRGGHRAPLPHGCARGVAFLKELRRDRAVVSLFQWRKRRRIYRVAATVPWWRGCRWNLLKRKY
jgi:hypothetical protein